MGGTKKEEMCFVLPSKFHKSNPPPKPLNDDVYLKEIKPKKYAAITFSGNWNMKQFDKKAKEFKDELLKDNEIKIINDVYEIRRYNSPWTIPMFKRNEVLYEIDLVKTEETVTSTLASQ